MRMGMLVVSNSKGTVASYTVASESHLIAEVNGIRFHFYTPEYPPPPPIPDDKNIDKMGVGEILDYLKNRLLDDNDYGPYDD